MCLDHVTIPVFHLPLLFTSRSSYSFLPQRWLSCYFLRNLSHGQVHLIVLAGVRERSGLPLTCLISLLLHRDPWINLFLHDPTGGKRVYLLGLVVAAGIFLKIGNVLYLKL